MSLCLSLCAVSRAECKRRVVYKRGHTHAMCLHMCKGITKKKSDQGATHTASLNSAAVAFNGLHVNQRWETPS